jgi:molybdenum cofactor cytidylyltransferase
VVLSVKVASIILAAGSSVRFGGSKQLARLHGKPLLQYALDAANNSSVSYVFLVVGDYSDVILEEIKLGRAQVVFNPEFKTGIASSVRAGVNNLPDDIAGVIIMVADQPFLTTEHLEKMIEEFRKGGGAGIVALSHHGEPRNPVLLPWKLFPMLNELKGDSGARELVKKSDLLHLLEVNDSAVFSDVDTQSTLIDLGNKTSK